MRESEAWYDDYGAPAAIARRAGQLRKKMARLRLPRTALCEGPAVDVGCGFGVALDLLHADGYRGLVGVDLHDRPLTGHPERFRYLRASADALPFADRSLRLVCCFHSLHHLADTAEIGRFLSEAQRVLQPGGHLALIDFHNGLALRMAMRLIVAGLAPTAYLREMRRQLIEERPRMLAYFADFAAIEQAIRQAPLETLTFDKNLFFFFFLGRKPS